MSIRAIAWVLEHSEAEGVDRLVLIAIANHVRGDGGESRPGQRRIAREARVAQSTASRAIRRLVESGELEIVTTGRGQTTNRYRLSTTPVNDPSRADFPSDPPRGITNGRVSDPLAPISDPQGPISDPPRGIESTNAEPLTRNRATPEHVEESLASARAELARSRRTHD